VSEEEEPYFIARTQKRKAEMEGLVVGPHLPWRGMFIRVIAAPIVDKEGEVNGVVTVFSDIDKRKRLQKQRDALSTLVTHDIKNHLAAESLLLQLLEDEFEKKMSDDNKELLRELKLSNERYLSIASTLLEIHRTDLFATDASKESIDLVELLGQVIDLDRHLAETRKVTVKLHAGTETPRVSGISTALRQVFHNVLQNAIYASPEAETIDIHVSKSGSMGCVEIVDRGPGIEQSTIESLFDHPTLDNPLPSNPKSTGFGLYLSRLLIDAQSGRISCTSTKGDGTRFKIELPTC
jgi:signal transduction histidine kinase